MRRFFCVMALLCCTFSFMGCIQDVEQKSSVQLLFPNPNSGIWKYVGQLCEKLIRDGQGKNFNLPGAIVGVCCENGDIHEKFFMLN